MNKFYLPDLGEGIARVEILAWHIAPGDCVQADQDMVTVMTDKAVVDIPAPYGVANDTVTTGSLLVEYAVIDAPGHNPGYDHGPC